MSPKKPYDERKLLELLAGGSRYALTQLYDEYRPRIYRVAYKMLKSEERADDIVQEVFMKIWLKHELMGDVLNFDSFIFSMTRHKINDAMDRLVVEARAKKELGYEIRLASNTDEAFLEKQYHELLWQVVDQLPAQQKKIFKMAKVEGLSHEVIGQQLKLSKLTVKAHMQRALETIRKKLHPHISMVAWLAVVLEMIRKIDG